MKKLLFSIIILPFSGQGQECDTIPAHQLEGITVHAAMQRTDATKSVYIPGAVQKSSAQNGVSLLAAMNIPQLSVNSLSEDITTSAGLGVSMFINSRPASKEDIAGLNPKDVLRVEYLDFPTGAEFMRADHVVNIITAQYSYGGYTKLAANERVMLNTGEASAYSKFCHGVMGYDLMLSAAYDYNSHFGSICTEHFRLPSAELSRNSSTNLSKGKSRNYFAGIRASWNKNNKLSLRNLFTCKSHLVPRQYEEGSVAISGRPTESYSSSSPSSAKSLGWNCDLFAELGKGWSLNISEELEGLCNDVTNRYQSASANITNEAAESSLHHRSVVQSDKSVSKLASVFVNTTSGLDYSRIQYSGSSNAVNRIRQFFLAVYAGVTINYKKVSGSIDAGATLEDNSINDNSIADRYPFTHCNVQYAPNSKNSLGLWLQYASLTPGATMKNPNLIQQSELLYVSGNPGLKCSRHTSIAINYLWLPSNKIQLSAFATFFKILDRQIAVYTPEAPSELMLKRYANDGDYNHGQIGARLNIKLFDNKLNISVSSHLLLYRTSGSNRVAHYPLIGSVSSDYYLNKFYFNFYWNSKSSYVDGESAYLRRLPSEYSFGAGWAVKGWNVKLSASNILRSSWVISRDFLHTQYYDSSLIQRGSDAHRCIRIGITYTFNYGSKIDTPEELDSNKGISSSILR